jgi:ligand-binding SRPBCC domain-containing protein
VARIQLETLIRAPIERVFDLARDIDFHQRSMAHTGERAGSGQTTGLIELGQEVEWEARHFGITQRLRSRITKMERPTSFVDEQVSGPFHGFVHTHTFAATAEGTRMSDDWNHVAPFGFVVDRVFLERYMRRLLLERNELLRREAEGI